MASTDTEVEPTTTQKEVFQKMLISAADYQRMGKAGIFADKPRVELIDGEIFIMSPITTDHNGHVSKVLQFLMLQLHGKAIIQGQGSVRLDAYSEPEPDIAVLRYREDFYSTFHARPEDIHLLVEVAVTSLAFDRGLKLRKYAEVGIPEYWIVIPQKGLVEVYREPEEGRYRQKATYDKEDTWQLKAFDLSLKGADLLVQTQAQGDA